MKQYASDIKSKWMRRVTVVLVFGLPCMVLMPIGLTAEGVKEQLINTVMEARPEWSQSQAEDLASLIASESSAKAPALLTESMGPSFTECVQHELSRLDTSPSEETVGLTQQYFRWAVAQRASRGDLTADGALQVERTVQDCFVKATAILTNDLPRDLHEITKQKGEAALQGTLKSVRSPLFPGLKQPIPLEQYDVFLKEFSGFWQTQKKQFDKLGGLSAFQSDTGEYEEIVKGVIEAAFGVLKGRIEWFGVSIDDPLKQAIQAWRTQKRSDIEAEHSKRKSEQRRKMLEALPEIQQAK